MKRSLFIAVPVAVLLIIVTWSLAQQKRVVPTVTSDDEWDAELNLANDSLDAMDYQAAYDHGQKMLEICNAKHLDERSNAASYLVIGKALRNLDRLPESEAALRKSLELRESVLPPAHFRVLQSVMELATTLLAENRLDDAQPLYVRAIRDYSAMPDRDGPAECNLGAAYSDMGQIFLARHQLKEAEDFLTRALPSWEIVGVGCGEMHEVFGRAVTLYVLTNRRDIAEALLEKALPDFTPEPGDQADRHFAIYAETLFGLYCQDKRYSDAERVVRNTVAVLQAEPQPETDQLVRAKQALADLVKASGRDASAAYTDVNSRTAKDKPRN